MHDHFKKELNGAAMLGWPLLPRFVRDVTIITCNLAISSSHNPNVSMWLYKHKGYVAMAIGTGVFAAAPWS